MRPRLGIWLAVAGVVAVALVTVAVRSSGPDGPAQSPGGHALTDLGGVEGLRARFTADRGMARLVLILSPT